MPRSRPILIVQSIIAGLVVALGTAGLADLLPEKVVNALIVLVGAVQAGLGFYLSGSNTQNVQVVATQVAPGADVVAGDASPVDTGDVLNPQSRLVDVTAGE